MTHPLFDHQAAMERVDQDIQLLAELVEIFKSDYCNNIKDIEAGISSNNPTQVGKAAHAIKSALGNLGAMSCFDIALGLENMGKTKNLTNAPDKLDLLTSEISKFFIAFSENKEHNQRNSLSA